MKIQHAMEYEYDRNYISLPDKLKYVEWIMVDGIIYYNKNYIEDE